MLCDIEWDAPIGDAKACGGNSMMRASVFKRLNGFRTDLIAGEEPELCLRLRQLGLKIWRIPAEMGTHDAAILRFRQWWIRAIRAGHAHAQGKHLHRDSCERYRYHETRSAWTWGLLLPGAILTLQGLFGPKMFTLVLAYPIQVFRLAIRGGRSLRENLWWAGFIVLGKFPEMLGQLKFLVTRLAGKRSGLIEYK
jgi:GT2 family glycosyltransferase